jgi:hypothetical protein
MFYLNQLSLMTKIICDAVKMDERHNFTRVGDLKLSPVSKTTLLY